MHYFCSYCVTYLLSKILSCAATLVVDPLVVGKVFIYLISVASDLCIIITKIYNTISLYAYGID